MNKVTVAGLVYAAALSALWTGIALATPTPQQQCDNVRITAWKVYTSCIDAVVAKDAKGITFDEFAAFAKCRHSYFKKWTGFQTKASLATSSCRTGGGGRFVDNGDGTVTDLLTTLVWEKKSSLDFSANLSDPHDADDLYSWGSGGAQNGTAFSAFLYGTSGLDTVAFAGASGWRMPTLAELETTIGDFACRGSGGGATCSCVPTPPSEACVDPGFDASNTNPAGDGYWSGTGYLHDSGQAWYVVFGDGRTLHSSTNAVNGYVRAVRGGL